MKPGTRRRPHLDAVVLHLGHDAGDDGPALDALHGVGQRIGLELLDAQADALLLDVDVEQLGLDPIALLVLLRSPPRRTSSQLSVGHVDHAVEVVAEIDEQAELGDVLDLALDLAVDRMVLG